MLNILLRCFDLLLFRIAKNRMVGPGPRPRPGTKNIFLEKRKE
jgi:hypothetical protein